MSPGTAAWILSYQLAPIVFCGGIAKNIFGGTMVITQITESSSFPSGLLSSGGPVSLDDYFANFIPLPGATLGENVIGEYPFANQAVAANAVIANPLVVSCLMMCPVRDAGGYAASTAIMTALASAMNRQTRLAAPTTTLRQSLFTQTWCAFGWSMCRRRRAGRRRMPIRSTFASRCLRYKTLWQRRIH